MLPASDLKVGSFPAQTITGALLAYDANLVDTLAVEYTQYMFDRIRHEIVATEGKLDFLWENSFIGYCYGHNQNIRSSTDADGPEHDVPCNDIDAADAADDADADNNMFDIQSQDDDTDSAVSSDDDDNQSQSHVSTPNDWFEYLNQPATSRKAVDGDISDFAASPAASTWST